MEPLGWTSRSTPADDLELEIALPLPASVYTGDPYDAEAIRSGQFHVALQAPSFPRRTADRATMEEARGHEDALGAYYSDIMVKVRAPLLWLRISLASGAADRQCNFPWWDRMGELAPLLRWFREAADGELFSDLDQGWSFTARRIGDRFHVLDHDWEGDGEEFANLSAARAPFLTRLSEAEAEARQVLDAVARTLGKNPWI